jgi:hypothetical protein
VRKAAGSRSARPIGRKPIRRPKPPLLTPLALVVEGYIDRETLEVLCGGGLRRPLGMQLCRRGDRRLHRHATLPIRDDLIATPSHLHELTDRQVEPLHGACHASMVGPKASARHRWSRRSNGVDPPRPAGRRRRPDCGGRPRRRGTARGSRSRRLIGTEWRFAVPISPKAGANCGNLHRPPSSCATNRSPANQHSRVGFRGLLKIAVSPVRIWVSPCRLFPAQRRGAARGHSDPAKGGLARCQAGSGARKLSRVASRTCNPASSSSSCGVAWIVRPRAWASGP